MMRLILCLATLLIMTVDVKAGEIMPLSDDYSPLPIYSEDARSEMVFKTYSSANQEIIYMLNNYSLEEMAQYAVRLNKSDRQAALEAGKPLPAKLSREILSDKMLIAEYLRSRYYFMK